MNLHAIAACAVVGLTLAGCAEMNNGDSQVIKVTTPPATGALCTLTNERGRWQVLTPGSANVLRSKSDLQISCRKPGWNEAVATNKSAPVKSADLGPLQGAMWMSDQVDSMMGSNNQYTPEIAVPMTQAAPAAAPAAAP